MKKSKHFDAVNAVRKIRDDHHERLKDKSREKQKAFFKSEAKKFKKQLDKYVKN